MTKNHLFIARPTGSSLINVLYTNDQVSGFLKEQRKGSITPIGLVHVDGSLSHWFFTRINSSTWSAKILVTWFLWTQVDQRDCCFQWEHNRCSICFPDTVAHQVVAYNNDWTIPLWRTRNNSWPVNFPRRSRRSWQGLRDGCAQCAVQVFFLPQEEFLAKFIGQQGTSGQFLNQSCCRSTRAYLCLRHFVWYHSGFDAAGQLTAQF